MPNMRDELRAGLTDTDMEGAVSEPQRPSLSIEPDSSFDSEAYQKTVASVSEDETPAEPTDTEIKEQQASDEMAKARAKAIEEAGRAVGHELDRFLTTLGTIAAMAPLLFKLRALYARNAMTRARRNPRSSCMWVFFMSLRRASPSQ